jgi:GT2 family glycosyltransferase
VLVNHIGAACLPAALDALARNTDAASVECIVVDSGSSDGSWRGAEDLWDAARVLRFDDNLGFCAGCNRGAEAASGRLLAFVNFDGRVEPGWDRPLRALLDGDPGIAVATGLLVSAASGALMMVRRDEFLALDGFYEPLFMYGEEADYCLRATGRVVLDPAAAIRHEVGHAAGPARSLLRLYHPARNRLLNAARHLPPLAFARAVIASAAFDLLTLAQVRRIDAVRAVARGWREGLSAIAAERRARPAAERRTAARRLVSLRVAVAQQRRLGRV